MGIRPEFIRALEIVSHKKNPLVVEIGSHRGDGIMLMRDMLDSPTIIGIEASPENFEALSKKVKLNIYNCAIGRENGFATIRTEQDKEKERSRCSNIFAGKGVQIKQYTLDSFLKENGINKIDLLRFDCYFAEYEIFKSKTLDFLKITDLIYITMHYKSELMKRDYVVKMRETIKKKLKRNGFSKVIGMSSYTDKHNFELWRKA